MAEKEKIMILGVCVDRDEEYDYSMIELANLCQACDYQVAFRVDQNLKKAITGTYVGEGKALEIAQLTSDLGIQTIVVNDDLSPAQARNLSELTKCHIIDRSHLILEIFSKRAKTKEAKLQVEIAFQKYLLPRLVASDATYAQVRGGTGSKMRGSGEKQIDLDRHKVRLNISRLEAELETITKERKNRRRKRKRNEIPTVAIVGYTNAGKSSLLNYFVQTYSKYQEKSVFEKDMLFATLDTAVRKITLDDKKTFLLSDTVGFVSKLPHDLIKAFRSTLEEVQEADLILHVIDSANPHYAMQGVVTLETLHDLGVDTSRLITVFNKADLLEKIPSEQMPNRIFISSKTGVGIEQLITMIKARIFADYTVYSMFIPYAQMQDFAYIKSQASVFHVDEQDNGVYFEVECSPSLHARFTHYDRSHH